MIRISGVIRESIVDGPGLRFVLFTQGCTHNCAGCHNPDTHDLEGGYLIDTHKVYLEVIKNPLLKGLTISGGEPFLQAKELLPLAREVKKIGKDIVIYTGFLFENLIMSKDKDVLELLELCDMLVDGPFKIELRDLTLTFKGSRNQRLIDMRKTLKNKKVVLYQV